jgi:hypothetical protein
VCCTQSSSYHNVRWVSLQLFVKMWVFLSPKDNVSRMHTPVDSALICEEHCATGTLETERCKKRSACIFPCRNFTRSLCLAAKKSRSDNTRQCSLGIHQGESQQNAVSHNRSVTGSYRRSLHSRDPGVSAQNICQNMAQNSTVL